MDFPLEIFVIIAKWGGPIVQYKFSICCSSLYQLMQTLRPQYFRAERWPLWHHNVDPFKNAKPALVDHLIHYIEEKLMAVPTNGDPEIRLVASSRQQCDITPILNGEYFESIDGQYSRNLRRYNKNGVLPLFFIWKNPNYQQYMFDPSSLLEFETFEFFDRRTVIALRDPAYIIESDRYHLIIRIDRTKKSKVRHKLMGISFDEWRVLSVEERQRHYNDHYQEWKALSSGERQEARHNYYQELIRHIFFELVWGCSLSRGVIQFNRKRREVHVTFHLNRN